MKKYLIYKVTFPNNKSYVGLTSKSLVKRQNQHLADAKHRDKRNRASAVQKAFVKYDDQNIEWSILDRDLESPEKASEREIFWISHFKSDKRKHGYNLTAGGLQGSSTPSPKRRPKTEEEKAVLRAKSKAKWTDPEYIAKQAAGYEATKKETLEKLRATSDVISQKVKNAWNKPGRKEEASETYKDSWASDPDRKVAASERMTEAWKKPGEKEKRGKAISTAKRQPKKPVVYLLCGVSGSGKSWVAKQLPERYNYISYDKTPMVEVLELIKKSKKPVVYDPSINISTFVRKNSEAFDIKVLVILGDFLTVKQQLINRGGKVSTALYRRWKRMKRIAETYGCFDGSSTDVLFRLKNPVPYA